MELAPHLFTEFAMLVIINLGLPLCVLFAVGFVCSLLQAITQIQDQIFGFLPKVGVLMFIFFMFGAKSLSMFTESTQAILVLIKSIK